MPRLSRLLGVACLLAMLVSATSTRAQNIIRNAGFESPLYDTDGDGRVDGALIDDWNQLTGGTTGSVIRNNYSLSNPDFMTAQVGTQQYFMEINGQAATIQQIGLSLAAGTTYYFSFYLAGLQSSPNASILATFTDGVDVHSGSFTVGTTGWVQQNLSFVPANTGNYSLSLASPLGFFSTIDDLRLDTTELPPQSPVPEPAEYVAMFGAAALAVAMWRRRNVRFSSLFFTTPKEPSS